ncbi:MAG TPA: hypothetical protein VHA52_09555, partial [Candidatus Babeliaceae bacterium]|nr:hypothetical protein [Candidatus Babeliaceae bacterium]
QIFVGLYQGSGELKRIGPCVWQMIWFSFLSMLITLPLSLWSSWAYFKGTDLQTMGPAYFNILAMGNFLFPLNMALTSFYLGRRKTLCVTLLLLASYALNFVFCRALVLGVDGWVPALGIQGAACAKCLSLGLVSAVLLKMFLSHENRERYATGSWRFSPTVLWSYAKPGLVKAFGYIWCKSCWLGVSYLMLKRGGLYLEVQTIGGTIITFLMFIGTGIYRTVVTITSNLLGQKNYTEIWRFISSLMVYVSIIVTGLAIPLLVYPQSLTCFFSDSSRAAFERTFNTINHWVWLYFAAFVFQFALSGLLMAMRELKVQFYCCLVSEAASLLLVYLTMEFWGWDAGKLWIIMALEGVAVGVIFYYRLRQRKWANATA